MKTKPVNFFNKVWIVISMMVFIGFTANATIITIPSTADSLEHFLENHTDMYANGDTIMLTDAAYVVNGTPDFYHGITVMGDPGLATPPVVQFLDNGFRYKQDSISFTLKGLTLNGFNNDSSHRAPFILRSNGLGVPDSIYYNITIEDVEAWGFGGGIDLHQQKHAMYDSIIVNNVIWHDFKGEYCIDPNINFLQYLSVTNSTFYNIDYGFLKNPDFAQDANNNTKVAKDWTVEHNTFYKVGSNNQSFIQVNDPPDSTVTLNFKNNLVSTLFDPSNVRPFRINVSAGDFTFENSIFHNFDATEPTKMQYNLDSVAEYSNVTVSNISTSDPLFADAENGDFTPSNIVLGSDNAPVGDPRWEVPNLTLYRISNDYDGIIEQYIEKSGLIDDGDTVMLTSSGTYVENSTIDIYATVTVMSDPGLSIEPTILFVDNGFRPKEDSISIVLKGFNAIGWEPADSSSRAAYLLRFDQGGYKNYYNVIVEDIVAWGFGGGIQLYKSKGSLYDSVIVNNVIFHDMSNNLAIDLGQNQISYVSVTNSTFYKVQKGIMGEYYWLDKTDPDYEKYNKEMIIDHNTFYNCIDGGTMFAVHNIKDSTVNITFQNNIASTLWNYTNARPFRVDSTAGDVTIKNSTFHEFNSERTGGDFNLDSISDYPNVTVSAVDTANPQFRDADEGNFTFPYESALMTAGTDGGPIGDPRWIPFQGISIDPIGEVLVGTDAQLTANVVLWDGADTTITWSVDNNYGGTSGAATIGSSTGLLSTTVAGQVKVTATSNEDPIYFDTLIVQIADSIHVTSIELTVEDNATTITEKGGTLTITATVLPANAHKKSITWSVDDSGIGTITPGTATTATLTAVENGSVTVTATTDDGGLTDDVTITISGQHPVESITVTTQSGATTVKVGETLQMIATVNPANADNDSVKWSVLPSSRADISATGELTALEEGSATVAATATDGTEIYGSISITIEPAVGIDPVVTDKIHISPNPFTDFITVKSEKQTIVSLYNVLGSKVFTNTVDANGTINLQHLEAGIYFVNVRQGNDVVTLKLIKK